ncbi:type III-B CRISPR module-associated protein Cmr5 [Planctomicrobium sp. SH664]|uniref:type III-B CRISPR module-associated protein Cmr5 n=1 Tax=Planctomicrobium sp. SH664 TaxID=3448125 RepID=UPI003F5CA611
MTNSSPFLTRDQYRAQHALKRVKDVQSFVQQRIVDAQADEKKQKQALKYREEYLSNVKSLPATIVMSGLGQACAMLLAKAENKDTNTSAHRRLYDHLSDWLLKEAKVYPDDAEELIDAVIGHGQSEYIRAQSESLAYLEWLKKFAQAYLSGKGA